MTKSEKMEKINALHDKWKNRDIVASLSRELSFEISESNYTHDEIIKAVEQQFPGYKFNRTESRYDSCIMAIFEPVSY